MRISHAIAIGFTTVLVACGGGGGALDPSSAPSASTLPSGETSTATSPSQPAAPAIPAFGLPGTSPSSYAAPSASYFDVSGTCTGTSVYKTDAAVPAVFEGAGVIAVAAQGQRALTSCGESSMGHWYDMTFFQEGFVPVGLTSITGYGVYTFAPVPPSSVRVGDEGKLGTATVYSDRSRTTVIGRREYSYTIDANAPDSAIAVLTVTAYDRDGKLLWTRRTSHLLRQDVPPVMQAIEEDYPAIALHLHHKRRAFPPALSPGQSMTLTAGQPVLVPSGAIVSTRQSDGSVNTSTVSGPRSTSFVQSGAVVTVPVNATAVPEHTILVY